MAEVSFKLSDFDITAKHDGGSLWKGEIRLVVKGRSEYQDGLEFDSKTGGLKFRENRGWDAPFLDMLKIRLRDAIAAVDVEQSS